MHGQQNIKLCQYVVGQFKGFLSQLYGSASFLLTVLVYQLNIDILVFTKHSEKC